MGMTLEEVKLQRALGLPNFYRIGPGGMFGHILLSNDHRLSDTAIDIPYWLAREIQQAKQEGDMQKKDKLVLDYVEDYLSKRHA